MLTWVRLKICDRFLKVPFTLKETLHSASYAKKQPAMQTSLSCSLEFKLFNDNCPKSGRCLKKVP